MDRSIQIGNRHYSLQYNINRVSVAEQMAGDGIMNILNSSQGMMPLRSLIAFFAVGLKELGQSSYVDMEKAGKLAEKYINDHGFMEMTELVIECLKRDCGFLFKVSTTSEIENDSQPSNDSPEAITFQNPTPQTEG